MSRLTLFLAILGVLAIAVLGANYYLSQNVKDDIMAFYDEVNMEQDVYIKSDTLSVNLLNRKIIAKNVLIYEDEVGKLRSEEIRVKLSWQDLIYLLKNDRLDVMRAVKLSLKNVICEDLMEDFSFKIKGVTVDYRGYLSEEILINHPELLLDESHKVDLAITELDFAIPGDYELGLTGEQKEQLEEISTVDQISFNLTYDSFEKAFTLNEMNLVTPTGSFEATSSFKLVKDNSGEPVLDDVVLSYKGELSPNLIDFGEDVGEFKLDGLVSNGSVELDWETSKNDYKLINAATSFTLKGFEIKLPSDTVSQIDPFAMIALGSIEKLVVDELSLDCDYTDTIAVSSVELMTPAFSAKLNLDVDLTDEYDPYINHGVLQVSNMSKEVVSLVSLYEYMSRIALPRVGDDIVIEVSGSFSQPQFIGLEI